MSTTLTVEHLQKSFSGVHAVDDVSFTIAPGHTLAIIGPNGSGKTTTLNLVTGTLRPDAGEVVLGGQPITGRPPEEVAARGLTRTFQNGRVFGHLSVQQNIEVGTHVDLVPTRPFKRFATTPVLRWLNLLGELWVALFPGAAARRESDEVRQRTLTQVERFERRLGTRLDEPTWTLSYANRRRTEIARALVSEPGVLVLDEPTAGMNQSETAEVLDQLLQLKAAGQTMLLVEHKLDLVMRLSDEVIVMDEGRVIAQGPPQQVRSDPRVISAYLGRRHELPDPTTDRTGVATDPKEEQ